MSCEWKQLIDEKLQYNSIEKPNDSELNCCFGLVFHKHGQHISKLWLKIRFHTFRKGQMFVDSQMEQSICLPRLLAIVGCRMLRIEFGISGTQGEQIAVVPI